jgi:hypothetical protein
MLAAAGWSFAVAGIAVLERPTPGRVRLFLLLLAIYLLPLVVVILFAHLDRFDFSRLITYGFFLIAGGLTVAAVWYLLRPPALPQEDEEGPRFDTPVPRVETAWLLLVATVTAAWGVALFVTDHGSPQQVWAWRGDLLTSRLIGVMLLAIAVGALASARDPRTVHLMLGVILTYAIGVVLANYWNSFSNKPVRGLYVAAFAVIAAGCAALILAARLRTTPLHTAERPRTT